MGRRQANCIGLRCAEGPAPTRPAGHERGVDAKDPVREDRRLWRSRERFKSEGALREGIRPEIARSWVRSRQSGVPADGDPVTGEAAFDPDARLLRVARPILDRLADEIERADMSVILTDARGLVLDRRAGSPSLLRGLDRVLLAPGHFYSEETVGTNGIGTAAEDRSPAWIVGSEHYAEWLRWLSCAGAPIRSPITGRIEGILDLTCRLKDTSPLMVAFVKEGVREIERRLYEDSSEDDRELLEHFVATARRTRRPVVALNSRTVITNAAAARLLVPADHALLWSHASQATAAGHGAESQFRLSEGSLAGVRWVALEPGDPARGAVLEIDLRQSDSHLPRSRAVAETVRARLPGRSVAWQQLISAVTDLGGKRVPVLVSGEPGVGKLTVAHAIHRQAREPGSFTVLDADLARVDGARAWLEGVRSQLLDRTGSLVLRHLEALDGAAAQALSALVTQERTGSVSRVMATISRPRHGFEGASSALLDALPAVVHVPPLRDRPEDLADIVPVLLRRHAGWPDLRCSTEVMQALMRAEWPGNVRQVESVIQGIVARRQRGVIVLQDLPAEYRAPPWRRLTRMERAEREAILEALVQTGGNKVQAAELLGISRATLYRRLKQLSILGAQSTSA
jgi:sigma-54 dependent transcriptional regulator, acetoin dehydrogenase operon transcriptional activator AcoR